MIVVQRGYGEMKIKFEKVDYWVMVFTLIIILTSMTNHFIAVMCLIVLIMGYHIERGHQNWMVLKK